MSPRLWSDAVDSLSTGANTSDVAKSLGADAKLLEAVRLAVAVLEHRAAARNRRRLKWAGALAVTFIVAGSMVAVPVLAQANCAQTLPSPLVTLCADTPALAADMNGNLQQLVTWIQQKTGTVGSPNLTTTGTITGGALTAASVTTAGTVTATGNVTTNATLNAQRVVVSAGVIQNSGTLVTATSDLGLYSRTAGNWLRFVTNNAPMRFYSTTGVDGVGGTNVLSIETNGNLTTPYNEPEGTDLLPGSFCVIVPRNAACPGNWDAREIKYDTEDDSNADQGKDGRIAWDDGNSASVRMRFCCRGW